MVNRIFMIIIIILTVTASGFVSSASATQPRVSVLLIALDHPIGLAVDGEGNMFFTEYRSTGEGWLRVLWANGTLHTLVSNLQFPTGVSVDDHGNVYFAESSLGTVKKLESDSGNIQVIAENLLGVWGVALDKDENLYVTIRSVAGSVQKIREGIQSIILEGLNLPTGVSVDDEGSVYFVEFGDNFASNGALKKLEGDSPEPKILLNDLRNPYAVALDGFGNIFFTEKIGTLKMLPAGDVEPVTLLSGLGRVYGLSLDSKGNIYFVKFGGLMGSGDGSLEVLGLVDVPLQSIIDPSKTLVVDEALQKVMGRIEDIRQLEFKHGIPVKILYRELLHRYENLTSRSEADWELEQQELQALYILDNNTGVKDTTESFLYTNLLGYYDSGRDDITIVTSEKEVLIDEVTLAHELTHALTDQYFPEIYEFNQNISDDLFAVSSLVEGDARNVEGEYLMKLRSGAYDESYEVGSASSSSTVPLGYIMIQIFPYIEGENFVGQLREQGGWAAVNEAYINPPTSTTQVIHPEKYLEGFTPQEVKVPDFKLGRWQILGVDKLGEFSMFTMLWSKGVASLVIVDADRYSYSSPYTSGWNGDWMVVYKKDNVYGYVWRTAWINEKEASEFEEGYIKMLGSMDAKQLGGTWNLYSAGCVDIRRENSFVTIIGAPNIYLLGELQRKAGILPVTTSRPYHVNEGVVEKPILLSIDLTNRSPPKEAILILQVKTQTGEVVHLDSINITLPSGTVNHGVLWKPQSSGSFMVEFYLWESFDDPNPLSQPSSNQIDVSKT